MPFTMNLWHVQTNDLQKVPRATLDDEQRLEEWVANDPGILGIDLLLIGRQVTTVNRGRIDLLALDANANLVVLELKRDRTPREIVAQALDYASWVQALSYEQIADLAENFLKKPLSEAFSEHFGSPLKTVNVAHSMIILASELDDSSERIVRYLSDQYGVPINVLFFTFFKSAAGEFLGRAWLKDPEEIQEQAQARKGAPWAGYHFVNVGEGPHRNWDDCLRYGFLSAGQGEEYSGELKRLKEGDRIFAYMKGLGYVGCGEVAKEAVMARDFVVDAKQKTLFELPMKQAGIKENQDDPALSEWVVAVKWTKTFPREEAKTFRGIFANQHIECKLRDPATIEYLKREFGVDEGGADHAG